MTPEERAQAALDMAYDDTINKTLRDLIATAIREAVLAERDACARVAEKYADNGRDEFAHGHDVASERIAAAIRSREE